jgi:hypothetical protein
LEDINFSRAIIDLDSPFRGKINFGVANHHHKANWPLIKSKEKFPDVLFLVDRSESTLYSASGFTGGYFDSSRIIPWSLKSTYHYELLGIEGALDWLQSEGILPYIMTNITTFTGETKSSGWKDYSRLREAKRPLYPSNKDAFDGTVINMNVVSPQLRRNPCIILMFSDGAISDWATIKNSFREVTSKHMLAYMHVGHLTQTAMDIQEWGCPVYQVMDEKDIQGMIIDVTKQTVYSYMELAGR